MLYTGIQTAHSIWMPHGGNLARLPRVVTSAEFQSPHHAAFTDVSTTDGEVVNWKQRHRKWGFSVPRMVDCRGLKVNSDYRTGEPTGPEQRERERERERREKERRE